MLRFVLCFAMLYIWLTVVFLFVVFNFNRLSFSILITFENVNLFCHVKRLQFD